MLPTVGDRTHQCFAVASMLAERVNVSEETRFDQLEEAHELLVTIPPRVLLGRDDIDAHADLTLVNEAGWNAEGTSTPYSAASMVGAIGYWRPDDRWGLAARMIELRTRFEDMPEERSSVEREITQSLAGFLHEYDAWWRQVDQPPTP